MVLGIWYVWWGCVEDVMLCCCDLKRTVGLEWRLGIVGMRYGGVLWWDWVEEELHVHYKVRSLFLALIIIREWIFTCREQNRNATPGLRFGGCDFAR